MNKQENYLDFVFFLTVTIGFAIAAYFVYIYGNLLLAAITSLLSLLGLYRVWNSLRNGLRPPSRYEWFRFGMTLRPIVFGLLGMAAIALLVYHGTDWFGEGVFKSPPLLLGMVILAITFFVLEIYFAFRAPFRHESDSDYKARIGWTD